jgi:DUF4097 and DUF4098 domain-containing protein YvlB
VVENVRGNARITGGAVSEVKVSGRKTVRAFDNSQAEDTSSRMRFEVKTQDGTVFIRAGNDTARENEYITADLEISVPKGSRIECKGRRGDFDVTDIAGDVDVQSENAGVRLQTIGGNVRVDLRASDIVRASDVKGSIELKGHGNDIELENIAGTVTVAGNYFGDIQFRNIAKPVRYEGGLNSRGTDVRVEACPGQIRMARGNVSMEQVTGPVVIAAKSKDVQVSDFTQSLEVRLERGDVEIRPGRTPVPKMEVQTDTGDIELAIPENARFTLKATAQKGDIENEYGSELKTVSEGRGGTITGKIGDGPPITLLAERGSIRLRKGSQAEMSRPLSPPAPKAPEAPLVVERN